MSDQSILSVMFVDDEGRVLSGLQRMLRAQREVWDMRFVDSGSAALAELARQPVDVLVSDMRMPGMSGAELLAQVRQLHPSTARFILSGQADQQQIFRTIGATHQYLSKPCEADGLKKVIGRIAQLHRILPEERLRRVVGAVDSLPSHPEVGRQLRAGLAMNQGRLHVVSKLIASDPGLSAKVLQLVNSAFFAQGRPIVDPAAAVEALGIETIQAMLTQGLLLPEGSAAPPDDGSPPDTRAARVAALAHAIALAEGLTPEQADRARTAGLLREVGRSVLAHHLPEDHARAGEISRVSGTPLAASERDLLGASQSAVGAYLLGLWGLEPSLVETVASQDALGGAFGVQTAVHVASGLLPGGDHGVDIGRLSELGHAGRLPSWTALADHLERSGWQ